MKERAVLIALLAGACADAAAPISLDPQSFTMVVGTGRQLTARSAGLPLAARDSARLAWTSSDTAVASVSIRGEVVAIRSGGTRITARVGARVSWVDVTVIPTAAGTWFAFAGDSIFTFSLNEVRVETAPASVSGSVVLTGQVGDSTIGYTVQGTHSTPTVSMQMTRTGSPAAAFTGGFTTDTTISGQLSGIGPSGRALTLIRPTCYCPPILVDGPVVSPSRGPALALREPAAPSCCTRA